MAASRRSSPRRSPPPEERKRDRERTCRALLDAALAEFSAHGRAGARTSRIAARAGVDKQLISYYFDGKDGLYRALIDRWLAAEREFAPPDLPLAELVARYVTDGTRDRDLTRLLIRAAMDDAGDPSTDPTESVQAAVEDLQRRQRAGEIADDLDPACLLLLFQAAAAVAVLFPADVHRATGLEPTSTEFAGHYAEQLRRVVRRLAAPPPTR
jgi:AcrR family transcriptional regulator